MTLVNSYRLSSKGYNCNACHWMPERDQINYSIWRCKFAGGRLSIKKVGDSDIQMQTHIFRPPMMENNMPISRGNHCLFSSNEHCEIKKSASYRWCSAVIRIYKKKALKTIPSNYQTLSSFCTLYASILCERPKAQLVQKLSITLYMLCEEGSTEQAIRRMRPIIQKT